MTLWPGSVCSLKRLFRKKLLGTVLNFGLEKGKRERLGSGISAIRRLSQFESRRFRQRTCYRAAKGLSAYVIKEEQEITDD